jgi:secretion/DNA translocation related TadE-like protein
LTRVRGEVGAATVLAIGLSSVLLVVLGVASVVADLLAARQRAAAAADLGALAGAPAVLRGEVEACDAAALVVRANGGALRACAVDGEDVRVVVSVRPRGRWVTWLGDLLGGVPEPTVRAHAGLRADPTAP